MQQAECVYISQSGCSKQPMFVHLFYEYFTATVKTVAVSVFLRSHRFLCWLIMVALWN